MKKLYIVCLVLASVFMSALCANAQESVKIWVDGNRVQTDVPPTTIAERTMLPARAIFEMLGATLSYEEETESVTAVKDDTTVKIVIGDNKMLVNDKEVALDVPAMIINDRTFLPVRACAEAFSAHVEWFEESSAVKISSEKYKVALDMAESGRVLEGKILLEEMGNDYYAQQLLKRFKVQPKTVKSTYADAIQGRILSDTTDTVKLDEKGNIIYSSAIGNIHKGGTFELTYDEYGRIIKKYGNSYMDDGVLCTENGAFVYNGEKIVEEFWGSNASGSNTTFYVYDQNDNLIKKSMDGPYLIDFYDNDQFGNCIKHERWSGFPDENGNILAEEQLEKTTFSHEYDAYGNRIKTIFYDENGNVKKEQKLTYLNGKLSKIKQTSADGRESEQMQFRYDENGNCVNVKQVSTHMYAGGGGYMYRHTYDYSDFEYFYASHIPSKTSDELSLYGTFRLSLPYKMQ